MVSGIFSKNSIFSFFSVFDHHLNNTIFILLPFPFCVCVCVCRMRMHVRVRVWERAWGTVLDTEDGETDRVGRLPAGKQAGLGTQRCLDRQRLTDRQTFCKQTGRQRDIRSVTQLLRALSFEIYLLPKASIIMLPIMLYLHYTQTLFGNYFLVRSCAGREAS